MFPVLAALLVVGILALALSTTLIQDFDLESNTSVQSSSSMPQCRRYVDREHEREMPGEAARPHTLPKVRRDLPAGCLAGELGTQAPAPNPGR